MKEQKHFWEADVRQKVVEHQFEYDPNDWADMEQLLDQAGPPPSSSNPPPSAGLGSINIWKIGFFTLLFFGAIAFWLLTKPQSVNTLQQPIMEKNTMVAPAEKKEPGLTSTIIESKEPMEPLEKAPQKKASDLDRLKTNRTTGMSPGVIEPQEKNSPLEKEAELLEVQKEIVVNKMLLKTKKAPLFETPTIPLNSEIQIPKPSKRKRDRKRLYPDVIDNY